MRGFFSSSPKEGKSFDDIFHSGISCSLWYFSGANLYFALERTVGSIKIWRDEVLLGFLPSQSNSLFKKLGNQFDSRNLYIGIRGRIAYYLFLSSFKLNGNVINTYIRNEDFERRRWPGNRIHFIESREELKTPFSSAKVLILKSKQRRFRLSFQRGEKERLVSVNLTEKILTVPKIKTFWKATVLGRRRFCY